MSRKKGTPKTGGRGKGTPNKVTNDTKMWIVGLLDKNREQFEKDLTMLEPYQRVAIFEKLLAYSVPKMQSVQAQINFDSLSDEQLGTIINELNNSLTDKD
jgi:hypothetical protein